MNRSGFTLIELLLATLIASILGALLFSALYQINRFVPVIDTTTDVYEKAAIVNAQLERDLSGVTAPNEFYARSKLRQEKAPEQSTQKGNKEQEAQKKEAAEETHEDTRPKKPLEKIFYGTNKESGFEQLTFITTNPLQVYWSEKAGSAKPRIARVQYVLEEEQSKNKNQKKSYRLLRKESSNLEADAFAHGKEKVSEHVLAQGIRSMSAEYFAFITKQEKQEQAGQKKSQKKEIKKSADWLGAKEGTESKVAVDEQEKNKEKLPLVPTAVEFALAFWDTPKKRSIPFSFKIMIRSDVEGRRSQDSPGLIGKLKDLVSITFPPDQQQQKMVQAPPFSLKGSMQR